MNYYPNTDKYPYPEDTSMHYLKIKKDNGSVFDKNYPYIDNSKSFRFKMFFVRLLLRLIVFPLSRIKVGLKIEGRDILKKNKELIKKGCITSSNHIHMWDYICIMKALRPMKPYTIVWSKNISGENGGLVRLVGGIPIPDDNMGGMIAYTKAITKLLNDGGLLHIYSEGSMWEYYKYIRPFKLGMASYAIKYNKPIIPMAFSYRKPGIFQKILKQDAKLTLRIGDPIMPDGLTREELTIKVHQKICELAGIENNIYEPIYNESKKMPE